jgi:hypothetical protein
MCQIFTFNISMAMIIGIDFGEIGIEGPLMIVTMTILNAIHFIIMKMFHNKTLSGAVMCVCRATFVTKLLRNFHSFSWAFFCQWFCTYWLTSLFSWRLDAGSTLDNTLLHSPLCPKNPDIENNCLKEPCGFSSPLLMGISNSLPGSHLDHPFFCLLFIAKKMY